MTDNLIFPAGVDTFADRHASDPPRRAEDVNVMTGQIVKIEQYALNASSSLIPYTPGVAAWNQTTKTMIEDAYDPTTILKGRYRTIGGLATAEFAINVSSYLGEPNITFNRIVPSWTISLGGATGGNFGIQVCGVTIPPQTFNVTAGALQANIRAQDGEINRLAPTVTGANPFTFTMPPDVIGNGFFSFPTINSYAGGGVTGLTGGSSGSPVITPVTVQDSTDNVLYIKLPVPMLGQLLTFADTSSDTSLTKPMRDGAFWISYDGADEFSTTGTMAAFAMATDNPDYQTDYHNWCQMIAVNGLQSDGLPVRFDSFNIYGGSGNILTGVVTYFTV